MTRPPEPRFEPRMPAENAAWIEDWHERSYREASSAREPQRFDHLGRIFVVPPNVMPITAMSDLLGSAVLAETRQGDRVLDMGTGCGVNAVLAAGVSRDVVAAGHLTGGGRMLVFFGSTGDLGYLHELIADNGFDRETVAHREFTRDERTVDYLTYRLTRHSQAGTGSPG